MGTAAPAEAPANEPGFYVHRFESDPPAGAQPGHVAVGGEFNNWSQTGFPMKPDGAGHFIADVKLAEGPHAYRFFVDGAWVTDSAEHSQADLEESNGIRGRNSAVFVGPEGRDLPKPQPGRITVEGLHHAPTASAISTPSRRANCASGSAPRRGISPVRRCIRRPEHSGAAMRSIFPTRARGSTFLPGLRSAGRRS
jgi:hypothetical protein